MSAVAERRASTAGLSPAPSRPDGRVRVWDNSNIIESFPGLTLPFTYSVAREAYAGVYRGALRELGVARTTLDENGALFGELLGHLGGRVYYNVSAWHEMLALLPGFGASQPLLERMMGAPRPGSSGEAAAPVGHPRSGVLGLATVGWRSAVGLVLFERRARTFERTVGALARDVSQRDLEELSADELLGTYDEISRRAISAWPVTIFNDLAVMFIHGTLRRSAEKWLGPESSSTISALVRTDGVTQRGPARDLRTLASQIRSRPDALAALNRAAETGGGASSWLDSADCPDELRHSIRAYLARWGDRCPRELQLDQPSYSEDPTPLLVVLAGLASAAGVAQEVAPELARSRAWAEVDAALARDHVSRPVRIARLRLLHALVAQTRYRLGWRERMRLARTSVFAIGRRLTRALDHRLQDLGLTDWAGDLHYLDITEVRGVLNGTLPPTNLAAIARDRRSRFATFASSPAPPDRFETIGPARSVPTRHEAPAPPDLMRGTAVCGGVVRARCRVILDPRLDLPGSGEIIVARSTDPGWVPLMLGAAGLLVEHGSLLSHSAIVARELGLPTIVGLAGATSVLSSGELIEMDGSSGYIRRVGSVA